ncbi:hypothetical protein [Thermaerobacter sp. FW80]|uniref:hypothetical protein n=1 Tax=Thermaerobacter sp. FW80 TaxID=2546351 RepID=UPI001430FFFA|nr:hypothetical protein [Thermaerobacter sp. FW80]
MVRVVSRSARAGSSDRPDRAGFAPGTVLEGRRRRCRWWALRAVGTAAGGGTAPGVGWLPAARSGRRGGIAVDALRLTQLTGKGG